MQFKIPLIFKHLVSFYACMIRMLVVRPPAIFQRILKDQCGFGFGIVGIIVCLKLYDGSLSVLFQFGEQ